MSTDPQLPWGYIKIEDSPPPVPSIEVIAVAPTPVNSGPPALVDPPIASDPRDPDCFLRRCSGLNKKTKLRCNSVIGRKSEQSCHPAYLPTCRAHRDQQNHAGWCQFQYSDGERCSRLFKWSPPHFELCSNHEGHPDTPCYFFRLPLELRHEIFRYLLPCRPIGSSTAALHDGQGDVFDPHYIPSPPSHSLPSRPHHQNVRRRNVQLPWTSTMGRRAQNELPSSLFPMPALDLFLVNRQIYTEAKDLLFSTVPFIIDVRKDGTFMCGRRLLEPRRADGSAHFLMDETDEAKQRFLKYFDFSAVKHYTVDILVENWSSGLTYPNNSSWDEEVELYDIRDYISVVVSGVLAKSRKLCKLQVHMCLADFDWSHEQTIANTKLIVGPFESLRNVRQPQISGVYMGKPNHNQMLTVQRPIQSLGCRAPICSVPPLRKDIALLMPGMSDFDAFASEWARWISASSSATVIKKPPIKSMFTEFKDFYRELSNVVKPVTYLAGRQAFLHRARVAREQEDVESFRHLRNELIQYWYGYLEDEERKKHDLNKRMSRMLDSDVYPSHEWEHSSQPSRRSSAATQASSSKSFAVLDPEVMAREGIPMAANPHKQEFPIAQQIGCTMLGSPQSILQRPTSYYTPITAQSEQQNQDQVTAARLLRQRQMQQQEEDFRQKRLRQQASQHNYNMRLQQQSLLLRHQQAMPPIHQQHTPQTHHPRAENPSAPEPQSQSQSQSVTHHPQTNTQHPPSPAAIEPVWPTTTHATSSSSPNTTRPYEIDCVDVACYAHVNLSEDWYVRAEADAEAEGDADVEAGPSQRKKRRVDSGFCERMVGEGEGGDGGVEMGRGCALGHTLAYGEAEYIGKGKGKMGTNAGVKVEVEVICID